MVQYYATIEPHLKEWALQQAVFFVASAPLTGRHVNLSPKGLPASSFSILNANLCGYVDATGSGNETVSHVLENGRVTVMFCSFETSPRILRLFCTGRVIELGEPGFDGWLKRMGDKHVIGARALILLDVFKVQTSCGFAVPYLAIRPDPEDPSKHQAYLHDRNTLGHWAGKKVAKGELTAYRADNNFESLDGLPGLRAARRDRGERLWVGDLRAEVARRMKGFGGGVLGVLFVASLSALITVLMLWLAGLLRVERLPGWRVSAL